MCIKRTGQALKLPSKILIARDPDGPSMVRFCHVAPTDYTLVPPEGAKLNTSVKVEACTWNGTFHSTRPFTFTLMTKTDAAVGDYVEAFRIYRNGDLMAAWNYASDTPNPSRVVIEGTMLTTDAFAATYPPYLAAMDLRVLPRETGVSHEVDMEVRDDRELFKQKVAGAAKAAAKVALPPDSDEYKSLMCLSAQLREASARSWTPLTRPRSRGSVASSTNDH